jgi:hypothetical protein
MVRWWQWAFFVLGGVGGGGRGGDFHPVATKKIRNFWKQIKKKIENSKKIARNQRKICQTFKTTKLKETKMPW